MAADRWLELLDDARWAPSPHNIQPWQLRIHDQATAELHCPPERLLPDTDPAGLFTSVGIGCFVECLAVAAAARSFELVTTVTGAPPGGHDAVLALRLADGEPDALDAGLLHRRRTSRLPYDGRPVPTDLLEELDEVAGTYGHGWFASSDRELVEWMVELNRETLFLDMADPVARTEVGRWLRFGAADAERRADGFSPAQLGFPGWLLRLFFRRHRLFALPGVRHLAHALYGRTMRGTRTVAWLRGPFATLEDGLAAGRMLMRLWLTMTRDGVQLHPFGSIITNAEANARLQERIGAGEGTLWLAMRMGYSEEPPRSHRREAHELLVA